MLPFKGLEWDQVIILVPGYVHSDSCARLITEHATDLVWLHSNNDYNLRLAKCKQSLEKLDKAQPWVVL